MEQREKMKNKGSVEKFNLLILTIYSLGFLIFMKDSNNIALCTMIVVSCILLLFLIIFTKRGTFENRAYIFSIFTQIIIVCFWVNYNNSALWIITFFVLTTITAFFGLSRCLIFSAINVSLLIGHEIYLWLVGKKTHYTMNQGLFYYINSIFFCILLFIWVSKRNKNERRIRESIHVIMSNKRNNDLLVSNIGNFFSAPIDKILMTIVQDDKETALEDIKKISRKMKEKVDDIMVFSELLQGKEIISEDGYIMHYFLDKVIDCAKEKMGDKNLELIINLNPNVPSILHGDEKNILCIISKIIDNAVKYTDEGFVYISIGGRTEEYGWNLQIVVRDSGKGMSREMINCIYSDNGVINKEISYDSLGIGISLPLCRLLIKKMGGNLICKSEEGKGSEFLCVIPQKVVDDEAVVRLKNRAIINVLVLASAEMVTSVESRDVYEYVLKNMVSSLNVRNYICRDFNEFERKIEGENYSHIIVNKSVFIEKRDYFVEISKSTKIIVLMNDREKIEEENVVCIYKPFNILKIAAAVDENKDKDKEKVRKEEYYVDIKESEELINFSLGKKHKIIDEGLVIGDLDVKLGITYCGNEISYLKVLCKYIENSEATKKEIINFYDSRDWKNYEIKVHALKSVMLTFGAKKLSEMAKALEFAAKNMDYDFIERNHYDLIMEFERVIKEIILSEPVKKYAKENGIAFEQSDSGMFENKKMKTTNTNLIEINADDFERYIEEFIDASYNWEAEKMSEILIELSKFKYMDVTLEESLEMISAKIVQLDLISAGEQLKNIKTEIDKNNKSEHREG